MAIYFTEDDARSATIWARTRKFNQTSANILQESSGVSDSARFDIFMSHAMKDADLVLGIKSLLEAQDLTVYVDWINDRQLDRSKVTAATARTLRKRMGQCASLVYVASVSASESKWMPWELGYFDGRKGDSHIAILPLVKSQSDSFPGQEYLGLYPAVKKNTPIIGAADVLVESAGVRLNSLRKFASASLQTHF